MIHIDDWLKHEEYVKAPPEVLYAMFFFELHRFPAWWTNRYHKILDDIQLYCTYKDGNRYRVTGCSRLGDVWLARDFNRTSGYDLRVAVDDCSEWSKTPSLVDNKL